MFGIYLPTKFRNNFPEQMRNLIANKVGVWRDNFFNFLLEIQFPCTAAKKANKLFLSGC